MSSVQAAIYLRGDEAQRQRQHEACTQLAEQASLEVAEVFADDNEPAGGFDALLDALLAGRVGMVITVEIDRLAASRDALARFVGACDVAGIARIATAGGVVPLSTLREMAS